MSSQLWHGFIPYPCQRREQERKKPLKAQGPENGTRSFDRAPVYNILRSPTAYSLPCTTSGVCTWQGRVPISGRSRPQTTMHDKDTTEQIGTTRLRDIVNELCEAVSLSTLSALQRPRALPRGGSEHPPSNGVDGVDSMDNPTPYGDYFVHGWRVGYGQATRVWTKSHARICREVGA